MIPRKIILTLKGMLLLANILYGSSDAQKVIRKVADSVVLIKSKSSNNDIGQGSGVLLNDNKQ